jgi:hypothetical protein
MSDAHKATPADAVLAVLRATPERQAPASALVAFMEAVGVSRDATSDVVRRGLECGMFRLGRNLEIAMLENDHAG